MIVSERLLHAFKATGWSLDDLIKRSGISCSRPSIWKKIHGKQGVTLDEYARLAKLFGYSLRLAGSEVRLRKAA